MDREVLREGAVEVEVSEEVTESGPRLRIRSLGGETSLALDPLELEGLTRLPFTPFDPLEGLSGGLGEDLVVAPPGPGLAILRNEFAMVGVGVAEGPGGPRLLVRNMASGAEVRLGPAQLERLTRVRHRDLAPLVDPSGLVAEIEPDPDQV